MQLLQVVVVGRPVLDLVLEALEAVPSRVANKALVSLFNPSFIPHMIGFKFSLYSGRGAASPLAFQ